MLQKTPHAPAIASARRRGRPKGTTGKYKWNEEELAWLGGAVTSRKSVYSTIWKMKEAGLVRAPSMDGWPPFLSDAKLAEALKHNHPNLYTCSAETLRKRFAEARRVLKEQQDRFERTHVHYER
jgi:hypothetical protein